MKIKLFDAKRTNRATNKESYLNLKVFQFRNKISKLPKSKLEEYVSEGDSGLTYLELVNKICQDFRNKIKADLDKSCG